MDDTDFSNMGKSDRFWEAESDDRVWPGHEVLPAEDSDPCGHFVAVFAGTACDGEMLAPVAIPFVDDLNEESPDGSELEVLVQEAGRLEAMKRFYELANAADARVVIYRRSEEVCDPLTFEGRTVRTYRKVGSLLGGPSAAGISLRILRTALFGPRFFLARIGGRRALTLVSRSNY